MAAAPVNDCRKCKNTGVIITNYLTRESRYCTHCFRGEVVKNQKAAEDSVDMTQQAPPEGIPLRQVSAEDDRFVRERLVGLPFVCISNAPGHRVVGELENGSTVRADYCEEVFNAGLCIDAIDGSGAYSRMADSVQLQVLALAEREYGDTLLSALPKWLSMEKTNYERWENRPRKVWPRVVMQ